jgi:hypothetical protein
LRKHAVAVIPGDGIGNEVPDVYAAGIGLVSIFDLNIDHVLASLVEDKDVSRWPVSGVFSSDDATKGQFRDG